MTIRWKIYFRSSVIFIVLILITIIVMFSVHTSIVLSHSDSDPENVISITKQVQLKPDYEYSLVLGLMPK